MKFYSLETTFTFGKYKGKNVEEVLAIQPSYLNWCAINLEHFYVSEEVMDEIKFITPNFTFSDEAIEILDKKYCEWHDENETSDYEDNYQNNNYRDSNDSDRDTFDALTDGQYGDYDDWGGGWDNLRDSMGY